MFFLLLATQVILMYSSLFYSKDHPRIRLKLVIALKNVRITKHKPTCINLFEKPAQRKSK